MSHTEKLTVNMDVVDIGKIDLLIEQGFYSNRTDFIKNAVKRQLDQHKEEITSHIKRNSFALGAIIYNRHDLEECLKKKEKLDIKGVGLIMFAKDIDEDLFRASIASVNIKGILKMDKTLEAKVKDLIQR